MYCLTIQQFFIFSDAQSIDSRLRGAAADEYHLYDSKARGLVPIGSMATPVMYPNQYVIDDGWLNFTATPRSSTLRMIFFCQAENSLGRTRSRKMVIHQGKYDLKLLNSSFLSGDFN